jgi:uncharacterized protein involved in outer membrane biogenesis
LIIVSLGFFLDGAIKRGVETVGPMVAKVPITLEGVSLSLFSGSGKVKGLFVGNPEGYKTPSAIRVGQASLSLQPGSVFADKVIIKSVQVEAPEVTFETDLKGNNLSKLLANVQAATGGSEPSGAKGKGSGKKLQVNEFLIRNGKLNVSIPGLGKSATVPLPEIHLTNLGTGPDGITAAELAALVLQAIEKEAVQASGSALTGLAKDASGLTKDASKPGSSTAEKISQGLGGLLKKK